MSNQSAAQTPAYLQTCARIQEFVDRHGLRLVPQAQEIDGVRGNKNWACYQIEGTQHKVYVERRATGAPIIHTTVVVPEGTPGKASHLNRRGEDARPGKIEAFFSSEPSTLGNLLDLWAGTTERLREARRPAPRASGAASPAASGPVPTAAELTQGA